MNFQGTLNDPPLPVADFIQIDAVCDRFEAACRAGESPDLAEYLSQVSSAARLPLFRNLLSLDLEYRRDRGEQGDQQSYQERFPELADVVESVFRGRNESQLTTHHRARREPAIDATGDTQPAEIGEEAPGWESTLQHGLDLNACDELKSAGYEITRLLGRGGMGVVYQAHQVALNRAVAIKLIRAGSFASEAEVLRFQNEAEAVAQLDHPHIVPIYEVGRHPRHHFFSMKLVQGTSLDKRLAEFVEDPRATARLVAIAAEAIHHAHQRGILHRDLKPANILLDGRGEPHITDFGLAKRIDSDFDMTHSNALIGTPSYMAPEQATRARGSLSTATDVYGLGTILYALLTGRAPFSGTTLIETLDMVRSQSPEAPSRLNPRVPRDLEVICQKCLEKDPNRRYSSALELSEDLTRWQNGEPIRARPVRAAVRAAMWCCRNPLLAIAASLLVFAAVSGIAGVTWQWRNAVHHLTSANVVFEFVDHYLLAQADVEQDPLAKNMRVRELLVNAEGSIGVWGGGRPDIEARLRQTIGGAYLSLGEYERAEKQLREAIRLDTQFQGPGGAVRWSPPTCWRRSSTGRPDPPRPSRCSAATSKTATAIWAATIGLPSMRPNASGPCSGTWASPPRPSPCCGRTWPIAAECSSRNTPTRSAPFISSADSSGNAGGSTRPRRWRIPTPTASSAPEARTTPMRSPRSPIKGTWPAPRGRSPRPSNSIDTRRSRLSASAVRSTGKPTPPGAGWRMRSGRWDSKVQTALPPPALSIGLTHIPGHRPPPSKP